MEKLTDKQRRFIDEYLIDLNAGQAAIRAGYAPSSARQHACRLLAREEVKRMVDERIGKRAQRMELTQDDVVRELLNVVQVCTGQREVETTAIVKDTKELAAVAVPVKERIFDSAGANRALELLGKHLGMFTDKVDMTSNGQTLQSGVLLMPEVKPEKDWENGSGT